MDPLEVCVTVRHKLYMPMGHQGMKDTGVFNFQIQGHHYAVVWDWNISKNPVNKSLGLGWCYWEVVETLRGVSSGRFQVTSHTLKGEFGTVVSFSPFSHVLALKWMALLCPRFLSWGITSARGLEATGLTDHALEPLNPWAGIIFSTGYMLIFSGFALKENLINVNY